MKDLIFPITQCGKWSDSCPDSVWTWLPPSDMKVYSRFLSCETGIRQAKMPKSSRKVVEWPGAERKASGMNINSISSIKTWRHNDESYIWRDCRCRGKWGSGFINKYLIWENWKKGKVKVRDVAGFSRKIIIRSNINFTLTMSQAWFCLAHSFSINLLNHHGCRCSYYLLSMIRKHNRNMFS